jgi:hypothetical protein
MIERNRRLHRIRTAALLAVGCGLLAGGVGLAAAFTL